MQDLFHEHGMLERHGSQEGKYEEKKRKEIKVGGGRVSIPCKRTPGRSVMRSFGGVGAEMRKSRPATGELR